MMRFILKALVISLVISTNAYSQTIKAIINQHIVEGTYDEIEGIWEGTVQKSLYFEKELVTKLTPTKVVLSIYSELGVIKGSFSETPQLIPIEITKGVNIGSFLFKSNESKLYIKGAGQQTDKYNMKIMEINEAPDKNGILISVISDYSLRKTYPLRNDIISIKEIESKRQEKEIENSPRTGTGFAISSDGLIVTNYHVIENAKSIKVKGVNGNFSQSMNVEILQEDKINDLAILKITDPKFKTLGIIPFKLKSSISDAGEDVFVLGYPLTATMGDEVKLTTGIISSKTGFQGNLSQYQISAPIQPGNSGGPLFDKSGNVIGVINSKHVDTDNVGYAIKGSYLQNNIDVLNQNISQSNTGLLLNKNLPEKVKILRNYVFIIEVNNE